MTLTVSVVVPTYMRPDDLQRCLDGLAVQERRADQVVVVVHRQDQAASAIAEKHAIGPDVVVVDEASQVAALSAGLDATRGDVVAITDDDAVPRPTWLSMIVNWFECRPDVGGVGGRDWVHPEPDNGWNVRREVGKISVTGRLVGCHHLGVGPPRAVDFLKGVNMAYRRTAIDGRRFDRRLRGGGAIVHNDLAFSRAIAAAGWTLVFDPAVVVDHYPATRLDRDRQAPVTAESAYNEAFNQTVAVAPTLSGRRRSAFLARSILLGDRGAPGPLQVFVRRRRYSVAILRAANRGCCDAVSLSRRRPCPPGTRPQVTLVAHDVGGIGGMERALGELVRCSADHVDFRVVSNTLSPELRPVVDWSRVPAPRRPFSLRYATFAIVAGLRLLRHRRSVIHATGAIVPNRVDLSTVHFCHSGYVAKTGAAVPEAMSGPRRWHLQLVRWMSLTAERWCFRSDRLQMAVAVSESVAEEVREAHPGVAVRVVPNGVDLERFAPDDVARGEVREELDISCDEPLLLFVGGDWERKGLSMVLEAMATLNNPSVHLAVIGRGDQRAVRGHCRALAIDDRVRLLGERSDVNRVMAASDIFVLPSQYETFSLVVYEAAAAGLAVCATRVGGVTDLIRDGVTGVLVDSDVGSLSIALAGLLDDGPRRHRLAAAARDAVASYTWQRSVDGTRAAYELLRSSDVIAPSGGRR